MGQNIAEKIAQAHRVAGPQRPLRAGDFVSLRPRHVMTHDNTAAVLQKFRGIGAGSVADPTQPIFALDHDIQNKGEANQAAYREIERFAREQGVCFYPAGCGIGHQLLVENGHVVPGSLVVASDSHANTYGALGALGTPVVRTDAAALWATAEFWWVIPPTVKVTLHGSLGSGVSGKDVILTLCGLFHGKEVLNHAIEFGGPGVASLSMDSRFTIANMSTEWGALSAWFPVDRLTLAFLSDRRQRLLDSGQQRISAEQLATWEREPLAADGDASYAAEIIVELDEIEAQVAGPDTVDRTVSLREITAQQIPVNKAYLVSCVNARYEDLASAAEVLAGQHIAPGVELYVAAASAEIQARAEAAGLWALFATAGATFLPPSCGPCIGLGTGLLGAGEVGISATNRNFKGRMGSRDARCYLASPAVVAASALMGRICGPQQGLSADDGAATPRQATKEVARYQPFATRVAPELEAVGIAAGFPPQLEGRLIYLPVDNLNTDGIYGKEYTYRGDMSLAQMAEVVMHNYDPDFAARCGAGDIVVGGHNFGTGSSREQAVTALAAKGIALVIAASFSQTYLRNAFNNGFLCVENAQLSDWLRAHYGDRRLAGERTIVAEQPLRVDFALGKMTLGEQTFTFAPLSQVAQKLVLDGGIENQVKKRLADTAAGR